MNELSERELIDFKATAKAPYAVFLYTPLCGTCKVAERMLNVALEMVPVQAVKCNVNFAPRLVQEWAIRSVPGLLLAGSDGSSRTLYRFGSVPELRDRLLALSDGSHTD